MPVSDEFRAFLLVCVVDILHLTPSEPLEMHRAAFLVIQTGSLAILRKRHPPILKPAWEEWIHTLGDPIFLGITPGFVGQEQVSNARVLWDNHWAGSFSNLNETSSSSHEQLGTKITYKLSIRMLNTTIWVASKARANTPSTPKVAENENFDGRCRYHFEAPSSGTALNNIKTVKMGTGRGMNHNGRFLKAAGLEGHLVDSDAASSPCHGRLRGRFSLVGLRDGKAINRQEELRPWNSQPALADVCHPFVAGTVLQLSETHSQAILIRQHPTRMTPDASRAQYTLYETARAFCSQQCRSTYIPSRSSDARISHPQGPICQSHRRRMEVRRDGDIRAGIHTDEALGQVVYEGCCQHARQDMSGEHSRPVEALGYCGRGEESMLRRSLSSRLMPTSGREYIAEY
ncbi:hypothetical protein FB45DRAFT_862718 [Roridomyces roridus]|uniref:Uncharacterized protein n=1 Tax=Roridomyces roridus TaxID=1738132 RepID=A0AAD7FWR4_9AGAR|nr:hypothetical protein FB45DRAFT_862718 [Roridomyces roridus]